MDRIRVIYEQDADTGVATSPEVLEWTIVADSYEDAYRLAEEGVRFALDRDDVEIKHFVPAPPHKRRLPPPHDPHASRAPSGYVWGTRRTDLRFAGV
jgi:hypothetical protein